MFSQEQIEAVRQASDILDIVVGHGVKLTPSGASHKGLCPFHREKTASFHVYPDKQFFKCYGCDAKGDVFTFVRDTENLEFPDVVRLLADRAGITLEEDRTPRPTGEPEPRRLAEATAFAAQHYLRTLLSKPEGAAGRDYLKSRDISSDLAKAWGIGFAPSARDWLLERATNAGFTMRELELANLVLPARDGMGACDRFRDRVMFPIRNTRNQVAGFGGRAIRDGEPAKYINTGDTPLFKKSELLYGLDRYKDACRDNPDLRQEPFYICEGYLDVIAMHRAGLESAVAPLGTSLTSGHVRILGRSRVPVVLVFDGDRAGVEATRRAIRECVAQGVEARVARIDAGRDPFDILQDDGPDALRTQVTATTGAYEFLLARAREVHGDSPEGRAEAVRDLAEIFGAGSDPVAAENYIRDIAFDNAVTRAAVEEAWAHANRRARAPRDDDAQPARAPRALSSRPRTSREARAEQDLLLALFGEPALIHDARERVDVERIGDPVVRKIVSVAFSLDGTPESSAVLARLRALDDDDAAEQVARVTGELIERQAMLGQRSPSRGANPYRDLLVGYCAFLEAEDVKAARARKFSELLEARATQDDDGVANAMTAIADLDRERHLDKKVDGKAAETTPKGPSPR